MFLQADSEDSDQTGRMLRLIRVFAGCTCLFVGFVVRQLIVSSVYCPLADRFYPPPFKVLTGMFQSQSDSRVLRKRT